VAPKAGPPEPQVHTGPTHTHCQLRGGRLLAHCQAAAPAGLPAAAPVHRARALLLLVDGEVDGLAAARLRRGSGTGWVRAWRVGEGGMGWAVPGDSRGN